MAEKFIYILENLLAAIILMLLDQVSRQEISVSIVRIAQTAGVSTATVSRVLNDMPGVRDETKSQVRLAVEALNYRLPANKRGPKPGGGRKPRTTRRTGVIAVIAVGSGGVGGGKEWLGLPVMAAAVSGITRAASQSGLKVMLEEMSEIEKPSLSVINKEVDGPLRFFPAVSARADSQRL